MPLRKYNTSKFTHVNFLHVWKVLTCVKTKTRSVVCEIGRFTYVNPSIFTCVIPWIEIHTCEFKIHICEFKFTYVNLKFTYVNSNSHVLKWKWHMWNLVSHMWIDFHTCCIFVRVYPNRKLTASVLQWISIAYRGVILVVATSSSKQY